MNDLEQLLYHASRLETRYPAPYTPYTGPVGWTLHLHYVVVALRALFGLPIVGWAHCAEPGCTMVSAYGEPGWRCFLHRADLDFARLELVQVLEQRIAQVRRRETIWHALKEMRAKYPDRECFWFGWTTSEVR